MTLIADLRNVLVRGRNTSIKGNLDNSGEYYSLTGSNAADMLSVNGSLFSKLEGSTNIDLGAGNDAADIRYHIQTQAAASIGIAMGSGNNTLRVGGNLQAKGFAAMTSLSGGEGKDLFAIKGGLESGDGGAILVDLGAGANTLTVGSGVFAAGAESGNRIAGGAGKDKVLISGMVKSSDGASTHITLGDGDDMLGISRDVKSSDDGYTLIALGAGSNSLSLSGALISDSGGNEISMASADNTITLARGMSASGDGYNTVWSSGEGRGNSITLGRAMYAEDEATNGIYCGGTGNDSITLKNGMTAENNALNEIFTYAGDDHISVSGPVSASGQAYSVIAGGDGNDHIHISGTVEAGALSIHGQNGYDVLSLSAATVSRFNSSYQDWITASTGEEARSYVLGTIETLQIDLASRTTNFDNLAWLGELVETQNSLSLYQSTGIELNLDRFGKSLKLSDFFDDDKDDLFSSLNLGGSTKNTLAVRGSLADNGLDADSLHIHGDGKDTVKLSADWSHDGTTIATVYGMEYSLYTNGEEQLLVQTALTVTFGA